MSVIFSPVDWQGMMSNKLYNQFYTALHKSNFIKVRNLLLEEGLTANHQFADGSFPLHIAADHQEFEILKFLLTLRASPDFKNRHGQTPLMLGITQGRRSVEIVQALVSSDCKVNLTDSQKRTALHLAGSKGLVEVVEILLKAGAYINLQDKWGRTPLHVTLLNLSHRDIVAKNYVDVVRLLLEYGSNPNQTDKNQATPLFLAVQAGDQCTPIFRQLLDHGALVDQPSRHRLTPLQLSVMKGYEGMCRLLLEENCNPNVYNSVTGKSSLYMAVQKGFFAIAKLLVEGGTSVWKERWLYNGEYTRIVNPTSEMADWLQSIAQNPLSLRHMCRISLRQSLGYGIQQKVEKISYPEPLKQYILLKAAL